MAAISGMSPSFYAQRMTQNLRVDWSVDSDNVEAEKPRSEIRKKHQAESRSTRVPTRKPAARKVRAN